MTPEIMHAYRKIAADRRSAALSYRPSSNEQSTDETTTEAAAPPPYSSLASSTKRLINDYDEFWTLEDSPPGPESEAEDSDDGEDNVFIDARTHVRGHRNMIQSDSSLMASRIAMHLGQIFKELHQSATASEDGTDHDSKRSKRRRIKISLDCRTFVDGTNNVVGGSGMHMFPRASPAASSPSPAAPKSASASSVMSGPPPANFDSPAQARPQTQSPAPAPAESHTLKRPRQD